MCSCFITSGTACCRCRGELCLTVTSTRPNRPKITGLSWETIAEELRTCPAQIRLAILDCCFAGQAIEALGADDSEGLADITHVDGVYTLAATTPATGSPHVPPADRQDAACTSFTGELQALIRSGIPGKPEQLTVSDIYSELRQRLRAKGLPAPSQRGTDTAHQFPFTANAVARIDSATHILQPPGDSNDDRETIPENAEASHRIRPRQAPILTAALHATWSIDTGHMKVSALVRIADAMAATDPDRAARLTVDAERIARSIPEADFKGIRSGRHRQSGRRARPRSRRRARCRRRAHRPVDPRGIRPPGLRRAGDGAYRHS